jgi:hypothetical protein
MHQLKTVIAPERDWTYDLIVDLEAFIDEEEPPAENKLGITPEDYKCPKCGYFASDNYKKGKPNVRCRCRYKYIAGKQPFIPKPKDLSIKAFTFR